MKTERQTNRQTDVPTKITIWWRELLHCLWYSIMKVIKAKVGQTTFQKVKNSIMVDCDMVSTSWEDSDM